MIRLCVYVFLMFFNYQSKAEDVCKASPIQQGKYLNRRPPKNWSNCFGEYIYLNSISVYKGSFLNGKPDGIGSLDNIAGSSYVGEWKDGSFHGKGIVKNSDVSPPGLIPGTKPPLLFKSSDILFVGTVIAV